MMRKNTKGSKKKTVFLSALGVIAIGALIAGTFAWNWICDNRLGNFRRDATLYVYPDTTPQQVVDWLIDSAQVVRPRSLRRAFEDKKVADYMKPGCYEINPQHSSVYIARMLNNGWQTPVSLTLSGTMRQKGVIARKIASQLLVDSASVHQALNDKELLAKYGFTPTNVFSMIIPDTYKIYWTATPEEILDVQKKAYDAFWTEERLAKAKAQGFTKEEVSIIASIVKGESNYEPEFPKIAGVYINRLRIGMRLQADPTIAYILDYKVNRILLRHLEIESPYNTYLHAGLPPGPIYVPTKACLDAVLNPDTKDGNLYFCANADFSGTHKFAASYREHLKNAAEFQSALNKRSGK